MGATLDMHERPDASPSGGFFIQSRAGESGNFEVVIPWPDGGLAHFWRENDAPGAPWHGPAIFSSGQYVGASVADSDFAAFRSSSIKNLEVIAVTEGGQVEHWWRENGGAFIWHKAATLFEDGTGVPALAYTFATFQEGEFGIDLDSHEPSEFYFAVPFRDGGLRLVSRLNALDGPKEWKQIGGFREKPMNLGSSVLSDKNFVGVSLALTTLRNATTYAGWREMKEGVNDPLVRGDIVIAAVSDQGALNIYIWGAGPPVVFGSRDIWTQGTSLTLPTELGQVLRPFRGRPSILQSDYGLSEAHGFVPWSEANYGNLEVVAPGKDGGILYFWRRNGEHSSPTPITEGWTFQSKIGEAVYDEVSLIQSNYGNDDHCNLELVARRRDQRGFDFFWREPDLVWRGPFVVERQALVGTVTQPILTQPLSTDDMLAALWSVRIDFSVPEGDLRSWLENPEYTAYPAIANALLRLLRNSPLRREVYIDVIAYNYEHTPDTQSPRKVEDVNTTLLQAAIIEGYNNRHGTSATNLTEIIE